MGWRDGPIEKNDVMCSLVCGPVCFSWMSCRGMGIIEIAQIEKRRGMESKSRILALNGVWIVT